MKNLIELITVRFSQGALRNCGVRLFYENQEVCNSVCIRNVIQIAKERERKNYVVKRITSYSRAFSAAISRGKNSDECEISVSILQ